MDFPWRDAFRGFQEHGGCFSETIKKNISRGQITRRSTENRCALPEIIEKHVFFQQKKSGEGLPKVREETWCCFGNKKEFVAACFRVNIISNDFQCCFCIVCFDVFLAGLVTVARQGGKKSDCLYTYVFFFF